MGALEETSIEEIKAQFETFWRSKSNAGSNTHNGKQIGGIIVNITSLGGRISFPLNSPYNATKFALEGLSESIQYELEPFGIN
jgi:short-subunit dehydrogenase